MKKLPCDLTIRQLTSADAEAFQTLRREVTADNPVPMGLTLEEELTRTIEGFRDQLSYPFPNAAFGAFVSGALVGSAAVAWPSRFPSSRHKTNLWGVFVSPVCRGTGLGRALVSRAISHAFENGVRRINLQVFTPNAAAVSLGRFNADAPKPPHASGLGYAKSGRRLTLAFDGPGCVWRPPSDGRSPIRAAAAAVQAGLDRTQGSSGGEAIA